MIYIHLNIASIFRDPQIDQSVSSKIIVVIVL